MLCRSCYHEIPAGSRFCPRCRALQEAPESAPVPAAAPGAAAAAGEGAAPPPLPAPDNPWEHRGTRSWVEAYGETLQRVLLHPGAFFRGTAPAGDGRRALLFAAITVSLSLGIAELWGRALDARLDWLVEGVHIQERLPGPGWWLVGLPLLTVAAVVTLAALFHAGLALAGAARGGYTATLKAVAYASAGLVFFAFPFLGPPVGIVWGGALQLAGFAGLHRVSRGRAALGCALPALLLFALVMTASLLVALGLVKAFGLFGEGIDV